MDRQEISKKLTPQQVLDKLGIEYLERPNRLGLRCPFHDDNKPSASIYLDTLGFYCFTCQLPLDLINFYAKVRETTYQEAVLEIGDVKDQFKPKLNHQLILSIRTRAELILNNLKSIITASEHGHLAEAVDEMLWNYSNRKITEANLLLSWGLWRNLRDLSAIYQNVGKFVLVKDGQGGVSVVKEESQKNESPTEPHL